MLQENNLQNQLVHQKENIYFGLTLLISILTYIGLLFSVIGIVIIAVLMFLSYFIHALSMASIRRNGVRISNQQFPDIYEKAEMLAKKMELEKIPNIYVMESSGFLNAFATRFFGKNMVVIYSEIFDMSEEGREDELLFVLAHEFAHLKRRHVLVHLLLLPAMYIPFLGEAYLRACEYTCDRYAAYYVGNLSASKEALVMLAIGKNLSYKVNQEAFVSQISEESGFFAWLSEKLASHPDLPKRINALDHWIYPEQHLLVREKKRGVVIGTIVSFVLFVSVIAGVIFVLEKSSAIAAFFEEASAPYDEEPVQLSPLSQAAVYNDLETIQQLIADGEDIEGKDSDGMTALQQAAFEGNVEAAKLLLKNQADVNTKDDWDATPIITAVYSESGSEMEMVQLLLDYGADPTAVDADGMTAYDYAIDYGYTELSELLKEQTQEEL